MIGKWHAMVLDCEDTETLATFYEQLLGMVRVQHDDDGWITIGDAPDRPAIAFQPVEAYVPPEWPGQLHPQQAHVDVRVEDLDLAEEEVLKLGATSMNTGGQNYRVYVDPQKHPFCLVTW